MWRSFWIAQLASRANLRFQAYLAAGFGIWLGCQALINIGVNMGVLPTKGLTLPLMSYGRSSMIVTLAWVGLLLRVYHEAMQSARGMATRASFGCRPQRAHARAWRGVRHERTFAHPSSSWPAAPAAMCSRRWRWRACCAPPRTKSSGWARSRGLEARVVPAENIAIEWLSMSGLRGKGVATLLAAPFKLLLSIWQALGVMRRRRPALVVGFGGFVTGPGGVAAWLTRRPLLIHEQNAIAGYSNRVLAHLARRVLAAFPQAFPAGVEAQVVGNPVRAEIRHAAAARGALRARAKARCACWWWAAAWAPRASTPWCPSPSSNPASHCTCATRRASAASKRHAPPTRKPACTADVTPFIDDMARAYADADLVICRAGALTISELAAVGVAAVLVPFPAAVDDHQTVNAQFLVREGAAVLIADRDLTPARLAAELKELCQGRGKLLAMAERARLVAKPRAAEELAAACVEQLEAA